MLTTEQLREVIRSQREIFEKKYQGTEREIDFERQLKTRQITAITGIRRCGKSTLLKQFALRLEKYYYVNFDDERLSGFEVTDFARMMDVFGSLFPAKTLLIDEIQNVPQWERFVRRIFDEGFKVFLTGSNSHLLKSELSTHLTGRYFPVELYPFSFSEYLKATKKTIDYPLKSNINILHYFDQYLKNGGFPEFVLSRDSEHLQRIYEDVLYKDILTKYKIRV